MTFRTIRAALLAGVSVSLFSTAAFAQIETVVVTAEKRSENIQTVPIAISAFSGSQLKAAQIRDVNDLQQISPSLLVSTGSGDTTGGLVRIRGVGTTGNNPGLEASVGVFVDGVYRNRSATALEDLVDVERIEVLRGPQGTLFGKNTTAGAISIISKEPSFERDLEGSISGGNLAGLGVTGKASGGLIDGSLAGSIAVNFNKRDGFLTDVNDGHRDNGKNHYSVKGQLLWLPNDDVKVHIVADYVEKNDSGSNAAFSFTSSRTTLFRNIANSTFAATQGLQFANPVPTLVGVAPPVAANYKNYKVASNGPRISNVKEYGISAQVDWDLGDKTSLTSITGYDRFYSYDSADSDYTPVDLLSPGGYGGSGTNALYSEELQLKGSTSWLDWLVGAFADSEKITANAPLHWGRDTNLFWAALLSPGAPIGAPTTDTGKCVLGLPNANVACVNLFGPGGVNPGGLYHNGDGYVDNFRQTGNSFSVFTHDTVHLTDELSLTGGLRLNQDQKHAIYTGTATFQPGVCGNPNNGTGAPNTIVVAFAGFQLLCPRQGYNQTSVERALTATVNLAYQPTDTILAFIGYSRGYKAGPFNLNREAVNNAINLPGLAFVHAKPEFDDNFEAGIKSTLFDGLLLANLTVFHEKFTNYQVNTFNGLTFFVINRKHAYSDGFEFETVFAPINGLTLTSSTSFAHARYGHDVATIAGDIVPLAGKTLTQAPRWTVNVGGNYETPLESLGVTGFVGVNANYRSHYNTGSDLNPTKDQPAFWLASGHIGIRSASDNWELELWGRNLFNEHYNIVAFSTPFEGPTGAPLNAAISVFPGEPATYGMTLTGHL